MIGLIAKNKLCFVDGTLPQTTGNTSEMKAWEPCNNMVLEWLIALLDCVVVKSVMYNKYASEIWIDLEERFGMSISTQIYSLHAKNYPISHKKQI